MKKILGISLVAVLTAGPAMADITLPISENTTTITPAQTPLASQTYVMGAYKDAVNTAAAYTNAEHNRATTVEGDRTQYFNTTNKLYDATTGQYMSLAEAIATTKGIADSNASTIGADENGYVLTLGTTNYNTVSGALNALSTNVSGTYANQDFTNLTTTGYANVSANGTVDLTKTDYDDNTVGKALVDNKNAIATEKARAEAAEGNLETAISDEVSARESADTTLQGAIDAEATRAEAAEAALGARIDNIATDYATIDGVNNSSVAASGTVSVITEWGNPESVTDYTINTSGQVTYNGSVGQGGDEDTDDDITEISGGGANPANTPADNPPFPMP